MSSLAVLKRYSKEIYDMMPATDPLLAQRSATFLLDCAQRTERGLKEAIRHPEKSIHVPDIDLMTIKTREGSFFAGDRPVVLAGTCGWFNNPQDFDYPSNAGFTVIADEVGPAVTLPTDGDRKPEALKAKLEELDTAAKRDMKVEVLLSPHYIPEWAYNKWPDIDPENRRATNQFMPWDIRSEHLRALISKHVGVTVPAFQDKPALVSYDLVNEAWYRPLSNLDNGQPVKWDDSLSYTTEKVNEFFKWYFDEVEKHDSKHPVYCKVLTSEDVLCVDREALGDILTANGMDSYPMYPDFTGELAADFAWTLLRLDFHRSLTPDKPILDGEYHISNGM